MQLVVCFGMVTNIYLPHGRFARWFSRRTAFVTGFHDDHHAMPGYPWHQLCPRRKFATIVAQRRQERFVIDQYAMKS